MPARRRNVLWLAALVHRLSGIALAAFLPVHFLVLGLAIGGDDRLDGFLKWTDAPAVKLAESLLILALVVHFLGGLRLLAIENFTWRNGQARLAVAAAGLSMVAAFAFLVRVL
jgi:fumarate reductase subunit D